MQRIPALRPVVLKVGEKYMLAFDRGIGTDRVELGEVRIKEIAYVNGKPAQIAYEHAGGGDLYLEDPIEYKVFGFKFRPSDDSAQRRYIETSPVNIFMEMLCERVDELTVEV